MNFRKFLSVALIAVCLFAISQSAFAQEGSGDTKQTALNLISGKVQSWYLTSSTDVDWWVWTNNSDRAVGVRVTLYNTSSALNYDLYGEYDTPYGPFPIFAEDTGPGGVDGFSFYAVHPGDSIYMRVSGHGPNDYSLTSPYQILLETY